MLAVYCIGIVFRDRLKWILWAVLFSYMFFAYECCIQKRWIWQVSSEMKRVIAVLPVAVLLGALLGRMQAADYPIDSVLTGKVAAVAEGRICAVSETKSGYRIDLTHIRITVKDNTYTKGKLMVYCETADGLKIGNCIRAEGKAVPFAEPENQGQFDEKSYYRAERMCCKFNADSIEVSNADTDRIREWCRQVQNRLDSIYEEILPDKHAGIVSAVLLGNKAELDADIKELYQKNGIAHILAISGLHVSLLGMGVFAIIRKSGSPLLPAAIVTVIILMFYGCLTGFSVSTKRAVGMLVVAMFAKLLGRSYDSRSACALCGLLILIPYPMQLYQAGFQLSFAAAFGISYFGCELERMKIKKGRSLLSGLTTQLVTTPIILNSFYEIPVYSLFLNIPVIGLLSFMVFLSIIAGLAGIFSYSLGKFFAGAVYMVLEFYEFLCRMAERLPFPLWLYGKPQIWRLVGYSAILVLFFVAAARIGERHKHHPHQHRYRRRAFWVLGLLPLVFAGGAWGQRTECSVNFLSVGQGDCSIVQTEQGNTYLIDCGSSSVKGVGEYRLEPWLKYHGISSLEAVFLSHPDSDHTNGAAELLEKTGTPEDWYRGSIRIKHLILPAAFREASLQGEGFYEIVMLAKDKNIPVIWFEEGDKAEESGLSFTCLHPAADYPVYDANDASMVLLLETTGLEVLFAGDVGKNGEQRLTDCAAKRYHGQEVSTVLKVAHHGSKNSTSDSFLEWLQADVAVISCGKENRFGHPHEESLRRLQDAGVRVITTPEYGTVTVAVRDKRFFVRGYK